MTMLDRRALLRAGALAAAATAFAPNMVLAAAPTDRRFVFIIQRGAADGLHTVAPIGDPGYSSARGVFGEDFASAQKLDGLFVLHPALDEAGKLYTAGQALFVHAVASPYRDRSHFDGQNVLETGGEAAYRLKDGWMNRLLGLLPRGEDRAIAVSATVPVALRGPHEVASYAPSALPQASDDLLARVTALYNDDPRLHPVWAEALATRGIAGDMTGGGQNAAATGTLAAKLLAAEDGARIAMIETGGWDTHAKQRGRLAAQLKGLDAMLAALKAGIGPVWDRTLVLVATEFGRTVAVNGTGGTDHGIASLAMLLGGGVKGGRVLADWPGLAPAALYEGRDLKPTTSLDTLIASALAEHFALDPSRAAGTLFPDLPRQRPIEGLVRA
jgi:uncharacterized protein (DUF1501 family)